MLESFYFPDGKINLLDQSFFQIRVELGRNGFISCVSKCMKDFVNSQSLVELLIRKLKEYCTWYNSWCGRVYFRMKFYEGYICCVCADFVGTLAHQICLVVLNIIMNVASLFPSLFIFFYFVTDYYIKVKDYFSLILFLFYFITMGSKGLFCCKSKNMVTVSD